MRRKLMLLFTLVWSVAIIAGCSFPGTQASENEEPITLNVYAAAGGDEYYNAYLIPKFEEAMDGKYEVNYGRGGAQEAINKIQAQGDKANLNIVITGVDGVSSGIEEGVWQKTVPEYKEDIHYSQLTDAAKEYLEQYDNFGVPTMTGTSGPVIAYNSEEVQNPPSNYEELRSWINDNPGRFMYSPVSSSGPGRGFYFGLIQAMGEDIEEPNNLPKTYDYLKDINEEIDSYPGSTSDTFTFLYDGSVDIIAQNSEWFASLTAQGTVPDNIEIAKLNGAKQMIDSHFYMVPNALSDEQKEASMEFINFAMSPEMNAGNLIKYNIPANKHAELSMLEKEYRQTYKSNTDVVPEEFLNEDDQLIVPEEGGVLFPKTETLNQHYSKWEREIQAGT